MSDIKSELAGHYAGAPTSRRGFIVTSLGAGFALAAQPIMAQQLVTTDSQGLLAGEVKIPVADGSIPAYRAAPAGSKHAPVIIVISEIWGVHEHIADLTRRLAKLGYFAVAPELFARQGDPRKIESIPQLLTDIISKVPDAQVFGDIDATVSWAAKEGANTQRLGVTGFCWGGRITWMYCGHNPHVKAGVAWYGRLRDSVRANQPRHPLDWADSLYAPVLGLYGGKDQSIPLSDVDEMNIRLQAAKSASHIEVFPDAGHAFNADYRPSYRKAEAEEGWKRMLAWFKKYGV
ncbi:MAG: dienelactone hydrolase family protein [Rhodocyclaceae bacterium]|nr:dienelactone hydrolase family protein [Rhodocyclaceae bacterium]MBX3668794.1 dienelactone hydrolase family protein [Rhodocyclaceae bacterium]